MPSFRNSSAARRSTSSASSFDTFSELGQDGGNEFDDNAFGSNENGQNEENQQRQHSKEFCEKYDKQKKELFDEQELSLLLEMENKTLQEKLRQQKLVSKRNELMKMLNQNQNGQQQDEQQQETGGTSNASSDHPQNDQQQMTELLAKIGEMKMETNEKFGKIFEKISELDNLKYNLVQQNYWDAGKCHNKLTICGHNNWTVHCNGNGNFIRSVFAKCSILDTLADSSDIFYFEILAKKVGINFFLGIAIKEQAAELEGIYDKNGTFGYGSDGNVWINGSRKRRNEGFGNGDTAGFGVNLANNQLFFTKNGRQIGPVDLSICSSLSVGQLFPFVSLANSDDKIKANFGPNFKFDHAKVQMPSLPAVVPCSSTASSPLFCAPMDNLSQFMASFAAAHQKQRNAPLSSGAPPAPSFVPNGAQFSNAGPFLSSSAHPPPPADFNSLLAIAPPGVLGPFIAGGIVNAPFTPPPSELLLFTQHPPNQHQSINGTTNANNGSNMMPSGVSSGPPPFPFSFDPAMLATYKPYMGQAEARRKNATREETAPLKYWLNQHRKNPYPTKAEKTVLAVITNMTMTQAKQKVSTWFANARWRLMENENNELEAKVFNHQKKEFREEFLTQRKEFKEMEKSNLLLEMENRKLKEKLKQKELENENNELEAKVLNQKKQQSMNANNTNNGGPQQQQQQQQMRGGVLVPQQPNVVTGTGNPSQQQHQQMLGAAGGGAGQPQDPEKRKLIQQQLILLLHAHKCQQSERKEPPQNRVPCTLPYCTWMKGVLEHMIGCTVGRQCQYAHCASSRQIILHWKNCTKEDCPVCNPIRRYTTNNNGTEADKRQADMPRSAVSLPAVSLPQQAVQGAIGQQQQPSSSASACSGPSSVGGPGPSTAIAPTSVGSVNGGPMSSFGSPPSTSSAVNNLVDGYTPDTKLENF